MQARRKDNPPRTPSAPETLKLIGQADALIAQALGSLQGHEGVFHAHAATAGRLLAQLRAQREDELRHMVMERMRHASMAPVMSGTPVALDPTVEFARRVRRRRATV